MRIAVDGDPASYHLFDSATGRAAGGDRDDGEHRRRSPAGTRAGNWHRAEELAAARKEAALAYLLLLPALVALRRLLVLSLPAQLQADALRDAAGARGCRRTTSGCTRSSRPSPPPQFTQSLVTTLFFVVLVVPISLILGLALAVAAHRKLKGMADLPDDLLVDRRQLGRRGVGRLRDAAQPGRRAAPLARDQPEPAGARELDLGPARRSPSSRSGSSSGSPSSSCRPDWQSVPDELLEAAQIDGAGPWTRFWRMTVPLLSPTIFFALVVSTIYAFQAFGAIDILIGQHERGPAAHERPDLQHRQHAADREQPRRRRHHGHGAVPHHAGTHRCSRCGSSNGG